MLSVLQIAVAMAKTLIRRRLLQLCAASALASGAPARTARAQNYPNRIIRLIAPFPPGGGTDAAARIIAARLSELLGQQVVVDNRPGAGSNIGAEAAARSAADGYTLLLGAPTLAINRFMYTSLNYDFVTDLAPVSLLCRFPNILAVPPSSPLTSMRRYIDYASANPGKLTYSSPGIGTTPHLSGELLKRMAGIEIVHVPYRGAGAGAITDALAGRIDFGHQHHRLAAANGALRAVARARRHHGAALPDRTGVADHRGVRRCWI